MTSAELARLLASAAQAKKARDVVQLDLRERSPMADFFVICEGDTDRQTRAIAEAVREAAKAEGISPKSSRLRALSTARAYLVLVSQTRRAGRYPGRTAIPSRGMRGAALRIDARCPLPDHERPLARAMSVRSPSAHG